MRQRLFVIIFGARTPAGRAFDVVLLVAILGSVLAVILESVDSFAATHRGSLVAMEWVFTVLFTIEYGLRIYCTPHRWRYVFSFFGLIDLFALLPAYLSLLLPGAQSMAVVRVLRLLRVFRVLKLAQFLGEAHALRATLTRSLPKITVFLGAVLSLVVILGAAMHMIEGDTHPGLGSIPEGMYWAIVTLTTVGYGDVVPVTTVGRFVAAVLMILGYGVIAVPTGIVTAEMVGHRTEVSTSRECGACGLRVHSPSARFCAHCGSELGPPS